MMTTRASLEQEVSLEHRAMLCAIATLLKTPKFFSVYDNEELTLSAKTLCCGLSGGLATLSAIVREGGVVKPPVDIIDIIGACFANIIDITVTEAILAGTRSSFVFLFGNSADRGAVAGRFRDLRGSFSKANADGGSPLPVSSMPLLLPLPRPMPLYLPLPFPLPFALLLGTAVGAAASSTPSAPAPALPFPLAAWRGKGNGKADADAEGGELPRTQLHALLAFRQRGRQSQTPRAPKPQSPLQIQLHWAARHTL
jgi:hypothetical protein